MKRIYYVDFIITVVHVLHFRTIRFDSGESVCTMNRVIYFLRNFICYKTVRTEEWIELVKIIYKEQFIFYFFILQKPQGIGMLVKDLSPLTSQQGNHLLIPMKNERMKMKNN